MTETYQVYTNQPSSSNARGIQINPTPEERKRLRELAARYAEIANSDDMTVKKRQWTAIRDLKPERPMILFESFSVSGFSKEEDLKCSHPVLRDVEKTMFLAIKQYDELKDDIVLEKYFQLAWKVNRSDYGVPIVEHQANDSMAYMSDFPIQTPDDLSKLRDREFTVDREYTLQLKAIMEDIFGDILPVRVGNYDNWFQEPGFNPFCGNNAPVFTMDVFKLMGYENMMMWVYDYPEALRELLDFLMRDRRRFFNWLKQEKIFSLNTDNQFAGPSGYGYVSELPPADHEGPADSKDCWCWVESQETNVISPVMFNEWYLPYLAEYVNNFGLVTYGCCEPVDDRLEYVMKAIPKLRTISVSAWNNLELIAEILGKNYVYCRKPSPAFLSGKNPDWDSAKKDIERTIACTRNQPVEFVVRDVYDVNGDIGRLAKWVEMTKRIVGI